MKFIQLLFFLGVASVASYFAYPQSSTAPAAENLALLTGQFYRLDVGMKVVEVQELVGVPAFVKRDSSGFAEHIYVLESKELNKYNFVSLYFDVEENALVKGVFQQAVETPKLADPESGEEASMKALSYLG